MNLRAIEQAIKNRSTQPKEEEISEKLKIEAQKSFELSERPGYQKIDFFLSCSPTKTKEEYQIFIISALKDERREDMLAWLQQKYNSSYHISKIPELLPQRYGDHPTPIEEKWKIIHHEESAAHSWQISEKGIWDESGDVSDVALQIYENGYIIMARGMDVRGFRL